MLFKYIIAWFPMIILAIINAGFREKVLSKFADDLSAHQISTVTLIILITLYVGLLTKKLKLESKSQAVQIGGVWVAMVIAFEFLFGHYVMGNPWSKLLHDYNLIAGRIWILIPLWMGSAPYMFYRFRKL